MRTITIAIAAVIGICALTADPAEALRRWRSEHPFMARTAVSGYLGTGVAVGEFSSDLEGDGNHESGALDWSVEIEHFFAPGFSVGLNVTHTSYDDKDFGEDLKTNISVIGGFLRYVIDAGGPVYPFVRFGFGSMEVEFEDTVERFEADNSGSIHLGGGAVVMVGDHVSLNGSALYTFGNTDEAYLPEFDAIVGFDVEYWTFAGGVSVYFP